jgi:tripeptide aminopeptidase
MDNYQDYNFSVKDRFIKYVKYDTQSDPESTSYPSTEKQLVLLNELVKELKDMGIKDVSIDQYGYVMATLPSNSDKRDIPQIGFVAHVDTSDAVSGANVKPVVHENYAGNDIVLSGDTSQIIKVEENPYLSEKISKTIITTDGTTLLGADDKSGVAEIMDALNYLITHPEIKHGEIKICFTPDEEIGKGTQYFDIKKFGAKFAYTLDAGSLGELENETFSADEMIIKFKGHSTHPGYAKNKMINALKVASYFVSLLPRDKITPEVTEKKEGFVHPNHIFGSEEECTVKFIIRDHETSKLSEYEEMLTDLTNQACEKFAGSSCEIKTNEQYRNMFEILRDYPELIRYAEEAMNRLGIKAETKPIRGGTDGARLSFMGLPCPNLFTGMQNFHSKQEWICVEDMQAAVMTIVEIAKLWEEKSE